MLYLDSHCECNEGWLEPLLARFEPTQSFCQILSEVTINQSFDQTLICLHFRIKENPKAFVVPIIDVIDDKTLEYYHGNGNYFQVLYLVTL